MAFEVFLIELYKWLNANKIQKRLSLNVSLRYRLYVFFITKFVLDYLRNVSVVFEASIRWMSP